MYKTLGIAEMGKVLSCARDFALIEGFNPNIHLKRTGDGFNIEMETVIGIHQALPSGKMPYLDMMKKMMTSRSNIGGHH